MPLCINYITTHNVFGNISTIYNQQIDKPQHQMNSLLSMIATRYMRFYGVHVYLSSFSVFAVDEVS